MTRSIGILFLILLAGCNPATKYTTEREYHEEYKWDEKKGFVKNWRSDLTIEWKN